MKRALTYLFIFMSVCGIVYCWRINKPSKVKNDTFNLDTVRFSSSCVEMDVIPNRYASNENNITIEIRNTGSSPVIYGNDYSLDYYNVQKEQWEKIVYKDINIVFDLIAIELKSHKTDTLNICLYPKYHKFIPGKYRVAKEFKIEDKEIVLKTEFFVVDSL